MPRLLCPSWRWITISGTSSRAISTAWAWRSWCGAKRPWCSTGTPTLATSDETPLRSPSPERLYHAPSRSPSGRLHEVLDQAVEVRTSSRPPRSPGRSYRRSSRAAIRSPTRPVTTRTPASWGETGVRPSFKWWTEWAQGQTVASVSKRSGRRSPAGDDADRCRPNRSRRRTSRRASRKRRGAVGREMREADRDVRGEQGARRHVEQRPRRRRSSPPWS